MPKKRGKKRKSAVRHVKRHMKKTHRRRVIHHRQNNYKRFINSSSSEGKVERILLENFVSLQKVMVDLSVKLDNLTNKISKMVELFEISAKALAEKDFDIEFPSKTMEEEKKILEKVEKILEQNKIIAKGLTAIHEKPFISEGAYRPRPQENYPEYIPEDQNTSSIPSNSPFAPPNPAPHEEQKSFKQMKKQRSNMPGYERSITESSTDEETSPSASEETSEI